VLTTAITQWYDTHLVIGRFRFEPSLWRWHGEGKEIKVFIAFAADTNKI
jgi:hypothetical protein